jgi:hypothetical protein
MLINKKLIIILGLVLNSIHAQQYLPLAVEGNIWSLPTTKFFAFGDTILDGRTYKKIYHSFYDSSFTYSNSNYICGIRDSSDGKTYFRPKMEDHEEILYDWNLNVGDSIFMYTSCCGVLTSSFQTFYNNFPDKDVISAVDSVLINGVYRKRIQLIHWGQPVQLFWIEGIGCNAGLFNNSAVSGGSETQFGDKLMCFHHYIDTLVYSQFPYDTNDIEGSCFYSPGVGFENVELIETAIVFPNPSSNFINMQTTTLESQYFYLTSMSGKIIGRYPANSSVDISYLPAGIYLIYNEGKSWFKKWIKR